MSLIETEDFAHDVADFAERSIRLDSLQDMRHEVLALVLLASFLQFRKSSLDSLVVAALGHLVDRLAGLQVSQLLALLNADGSIDYIRKTATGVRGTLSSITDAKGNYIAAKSFENTLNDDDYPFRNKGLLTDYYKNGYEAGWEINPGKVYGQYG